ncbi:uncharacterized protein LOC127867494 isoform X2 [Dreissena polymorpha]|uniref:uncharacterized protein LOC127867494 isoform X2 n=1 Tax=Dreissena polymorpha TaxID=45954 RepID=UPI0022640B3D|nr:uncharacterized protein LOC127867494 isoform X2 [Dreissena polymorpha]
MGNCMCKPLCQENVVTEYKDNLGYDSEDETGSEEGENEGSDESSDSGPRERFYCERAEVEFTKKKEITRPRRQDIDELVQLAVNEDRLAEMLETDIDEDFTTDELEEYYTKRDALVGEYTDDVLEAELVVLGIEADSVYNIGDNYRPLGAPSDVMLSTSTSSVFRYLQHLQSPSVMASFIRVTTVIPDRGSYERYTLHPCYAFDSRCSLRVLWTPNANDDNTNDPDVWVVIEIMRVSTRSVDLHSRASISPDLRYEYRSWSFSNCSRISYRSVECIESGLRTVDLWGICEYFETRLSVHYEMSPCQRRISSDTRIELQRNASGARHILNETRRHSSAELNRNSMSRQGFYSEQSFYRCVSGCSTPLRSGHCQTNSFVPNFINESKSHDVRAAISHFDDEEHASLRQADSTSSIFAYSSHASIFSSSSVCLSAYGRLPHNSEGSASQTSYGSIASHRSESSPAEECLSDDEVISGDIQLQAHGTVNVVKAGISYHVRFCEDVMVVVPPPGPFFDCGRSCYCIDNVVKDDLVKDDVVKVVPIHPIVENSSLPECATEVTNNKKFQFKGAFARHFPTERYPARQSPERDLIEADDMPDAHVEKNKSRRSKIGKFLRRLFTRSRKKRKSKPSRS